MANQIIDYKKYGSEYYVNRNLVGKERKTALMRRALEQKEQVRSS